MNFDATLLPWRPAPALPYEGKAITPHDSVGGARAMGLRNEDGDVVECVVPYARYVRAVDPSGNVVPVVVSTNRVDAEDATGYETKMYKTKRAAGWLFVDEAPHGMSLDEWHDKLGEIVAERRAKHAEVESRKASAYQTHADALAKANSAMLESLIKRMFQEMRAVTQPEGEEDDE